MYRVKLDENGDARNPWRMSMFNVHDFDEQYSFYNDDVTLGIPDPQTGILRGKESIRGHFMPLFTGVDELIVPMILAIGGRNVLLAMESFFR